MIIIIIITNTSMPNCMQYATQPQRYSLIRLSSYENHQISLLQTFCMRRSMVGEPILGDAGFELMKLEADRQYTATSVP